MSSKKTPQSLPDQPEPAPAPATSETTSTPPLTPEQTLEKLLALWGESEKLLKNLTPEPLKQDALLASILSELDENDVFLRIRAEVFTKDGLSFNVKGSQVLPDALAAHNHGDSPKHFEHAIYMLCMSPLNKKFLAIVNGRVTNVNPERVGDNPLHNSSGSTFDSVPLSPND
jgi:hypothetical protein